jgi:membrane AbrB-like protein
MFIKIILLLVIAAAGAASFKKLKVPGGALIGSMIFTLAANSLLIHYDELPNWFVFLLQVFAGIVIGQEIDKGFLSELKKTALPGVISSLGLIISALLLMAGLHRFCNWDLATAWLAMCPGRMVDMVLIAETVKADSFKVLLAHLVRQILVMIFTPVVLARGKAKQTI